MEFKQEINEVQTAINAGLALTEIRSIDQVPFVVVPEGATIESLERFLDEPARKTGNVEMRDTKSFIQYVNEEKELGTRIYANYQKPHFTGVINDHMKDAPGWKDHRVIYRCPQSIEWQTWNRSNKSTVTQEAFAQFIEDNLPDIAQPPAAEMLEISRTLEAKKKVNFASGIRLSNGQNELTYEESISGTAGKGKFVVPEMFVIGIPVLEGGERYAVEARLRYRIGESGKLTMWYELVRPHKILEDAVKAVCAEIEAATELTIFNGDL